MEEGLWSTAPARRRGRGGKTGVERKACMHSSLTAVLWWVDSKAGAAVIVTFSRPSWAQRVYKYPDY